MSFPALASVNLQHSSLKRVFDLFEQWYISGHERKYPIYMPESSNEDDVFVHEEGPTSYH